MKDKCSIPIHVADFILQIAKKNLHNAFNDYFTSIFTQEDLSTLPTISGIPFPDIPPISISVEGVASLLRKWFKPLQGHWTR